MILIPAASASVTDTIGVLCDYFNFTYTECNNLIENITTPGTVIKNTTYYVHKNYSHAYYNNYTLSRSEVLEIQEDIYDDILEEVEEDYVLKDEFDEYLDDVIDQNEIEFQRYKLDREFQLELARLNINLSPTETTDSEEDCDFLCEAKKQFTQNLELERYKLQMCYLYPEMDICTVKRMAVNLSPSTYSDNEQMINLIDRLENRIDNLDNGNTNNRVSSNPFNFGDKNTLTFILLIGLGAAVYFYLRKQEKKSELVVPTPTKTVDKEAHQRAKEEIVRLQNELVKSKTDKSSSI